MRLLDEATQTPLTLVVAAAGSGKTLTLARWTRARSPLPVMWVSSASETTPVRLVNLVLAANRLPRIQSGRRIPLQVLIEQAAEALHDSEAQQLVVIDDAHLMSAACFTVIDELLNRCPAALRLVVLCRWDPPIARLVPALHGNLTVIRGNAFQMTAEEARELVSAHSRQLPSDVVELIVQRARGWAAVLVLAARLVASSPDPEGSVEHLTDRGFVVADMLASQVFSTLPNRARHLLLCIGAEETVDADTAAHLSGDPGAGAMLDELEAFGLLVARDEQAVVAGAGDRFRVHPLLTEVLRRRLQAGGVEVARARAMVLQAARWSVAHGDSRNGLRRLVAAQGWPDAVALIAEQGVELLVRGDLELIETVAVSAPEVVEAHPESWASMALLHWLRLDHAGARHWYERLTHETSQEGAAAHATALLRLMHARIGREPIIVAVAHARSLVGEDRTTTDHAALLSWLLVELGAAENWLGRFHDAQKHLRWAASTAESAALDRMVAAALSHAALSEYLQGRHRDATVSASRALDLIAGDDRLARATSARARVAQELARPHQPAEIPDLIDFSATAGSPTLTDPATSVLHCILSSRLLLAGGSVDEAAAALTVTRVLPELSPHMAAALLAEESLHAFLRNDPALQEKIAGDYLELDAPAEAALADAFRFDRAGDRHAAATRLEPVAAGRMRPMLAATRVVAMVFKAQLDDSLGDAGTADGELAEAVRRTAAQMDSDPFVSWSMQGTPTIELLHRLARSDPSAWLGELLVVADERDGLAATMRAAREAPAPQMTQPVPGDHVHIPGLTRREHDVLVQLANGSSYADIAETLFVSENTVKTHVSSLYAKLGATRRSQALKIARAQRLL